MTNEYKKITPDDVYVTISNRKPTEEELWSGIPNNFNGNRPSGNDFIDLFARLIRKHQFLPIGFYAKEIGCDPVSLNRTMHVLGGMTASQWRNRYIVLSACELLKTTNHEIQVVAKLLNFTRTTIFTQFFIHHTGLSPKQWRERKA